MRKKSETRLFCALILALLALAWSPPAPASALGSSTTASPNWAFDAPQYPTGALADTSCVSSAGYIYCVGGAAAPATPGGYSTPSSSVYFAKETPPASGSQGASSSTSAQPPLSAWTLSPNPYPAAISQESCVSSSGYIYCVGGCVGPSSPCTLTPSVFYAPLTSSGVGKWTATTSYPYAIAATNCVINSGFIYCIGALSDIGGRGVDAGSYFAPISATGVGKWASAGTGQYVTYGSCFTAAGYVYCVGGTTGFDAGHNTTTYAPLLTTGIGNWAKTTSYPFAMVRVSCAVDSVTVYCVGPTGSNACISSGACPTVFTATLSSTGIGPWSSIANGPASVQSNSSCSVDAGFIYCIGAVQVTQTSKTNLVAYYPLSVKTPIIFLPGVAGTQLLNGSTEVWPYISGVATAIYGAAPDSTFLPLQLNPAGSAPSNPASKINVGWVLCPSPKPPSCFSKTDFYGSLMKNLTGQGYTLGKDLFAFGYDWRLDNQVHFGELNQLIGTAMKNSGSNSTILMAHSMGGVISRGYLLYCNSKPSDPSCTNYKHVTTLITIGTPNFGATKVYYGMLMGYNFGNPKAGVNVMKAMLLNFPAAYELLPQAPFVYAGYGCQACPAGTPTPGYGGRDLLPLDWSFSIMSKGLTATSSGYSPTSSNTWTMNQALLVQSAKFYGPVGSQSNPNPLPASVKYYAIIGYGVSTLVNYVARDAQPQDETFLSTPDGRHVVLEPVFGDGDGTVPMWSLAATGSTATKYFVPYESHTFTSDVSSKHGDLPANPTVQGIVKSILGGKPADASKFGYPDALPELESNNEYVGAPHLSSSIDFVLHSNAQMTVTNAKGGLLGLNSTTGVIDETVGTGTYIAMDGVEYASMENLTQSSTVKVLGTSTGEFSLTVNVHSPTGSKSFTYPNVPVTSGASTQLSFTGSSLLASSATPPALVVTSSGGVTSTIQAGSVTTTSSKGPGISSTQAGYAQTGTGSGTSSSLNFSSIPELLPAQVLSPLSPYLQPISSATGLRPDLIIVGAVVLLILLGAISRVARRGRKKK